MRKLDTRAARRRGAQDLLAWALLIFTTYLAYGLGLALPPPPSVAVAGVLIVLVVAAWVLEWPLLVPVWIGSSLVAFLVFARPLLDHGLLGHRRVAARGSVGAPRGCGHQRRSDLTADIPRTECEEGVAAADDRSAGVPSPPAPSNHCSWGGARADHARLRGRDDGRGRIRVRGLRRGSLGEPRLASPGWERHAARVDVPGAPARLRTELHAGQRHSAARAAMARGHAAAAGRGRRAPAAPTGRPRPGLQSPLGALEASGARLRGDLGGDIEAARGYRRGHPHDGVRSAADPRRRTGAVDAPGRRYRALPAATGVRVAGIASWYGGEVRGNRSYPEPHTSVRVGPQLHRRGGTDQRVEARAGVEGRK